MKKNVLALSIAAAVGGFGFVGGAQAMTGTLGGAGVGSNLTLSALSGIGHSLLVPYFSTQDTNATLLNIVNTDTVRGKAVKVRFRGAANSDDIFDFQVFLSPGDVWTANVVKNANGLSQLTTSDLSCTKPAKAVLNVTPFVTTRLDPSLTAAQKANGTREGYVEIFNMADIPPTASGTVADAVAATTAGQFAPAPSTSTANTLYTVIKHPAKAAPPCDGGAWTALDTNNLVWNTVTAGGNPRSFGLLPPTTGLMANWTIINTVTAAAWSGSATAIQASSAGVATTGNVVYWPQTGDAVSPAEANFYTADPLLRSDRVYNATSGVLVADTTPPVIAGYYDLPDLSTPYTVAAQSLLARDARDPLDQAYFLTNAIAVASATNEWLTNSDIKAATDWVFSMPTRRYSVALDYAAIKTTDDGRRFSDVGLPFGVLPVGYAPLSTGWFLPGNTLVTTDTLGNGSQICVKNITTAPNDREENGVSTPTAVVVSPSTPADPLSFCGEAAVLSMNNGGRAAGASKSLNASVAWKDLDVTYADGWMKINTPSQAGSGVTGLPVLGASFVRAYSATQSFGATYDHRLR